MNNLFFSTTVHLAVWPPELQKWDPIELHDTSESVEKMHRFCHGKYNIPITWIVNYAALMKHKERLKEFCREYGDEVAIMEYGIYSEDAMDGKAELYQGWVEELGMVRPGALNHDEKDVPGLVTWYAMDYEDQKKGIAFLKKRYEEELGCEVVTFANPFINKDTMRVLKELGFDCVWGNNWNYFCEGMDHKGSLPHPFYRNINDYNAPETGESDRGPLSIPWGTNNLCVSANVERMCRRSPAWCTNPMEYANRSVGLDEYDYFSKIADEWAGNREYNPFIYMPIQMEGLWMDEGEMLGGRVDPYPDYTLRSVEVFYSQIEKCLSLGATCLTQKGFAKWHKENMGETTDFLFLSKDYIGDLRGNGKDMEYPPLVVYATKKKQYIFSKANGYNCMFSWDYDNSEKSVKDKIFSENVPRVQLKNGYSLRVQAGIHVTPQRAEYRVLGLAFSSYHDYPDYGGILWKAGLPSYVNEDNLKLENLSSVKLMKKDDILLFFADMKEGDNEFEIYSDAPDRFVKTESVEEVGKHLEIWISNTGDEAELSSVSANIGTGRRLGGFWWNGQMHKTVDKFNGCMYDRDTGDFCLSACYPVTFRLRHGLNRLTLELL